MRGATVEPHRVMLGGAVIDYLLVRWLASKYRLMDDKAALKAMWPLRKFASKFAKGQHAELARSVRTGLDLAALAVAQAKWAGPQPEVLRHSTVPGHRYLRVASADAPYVIFSDHHIAYETHRSSFWHESGNVELYGEVLEHYLDNDHEWTLVENGDVEELVILEPDQQVADEYKRLGRTYRKHIDDWNLDIEQQLRDELRAIRKPKRLEQLKLIGADERNKAHYYSKLERFAADDRLIRVAGNHDFDFQYDEFLDAAPSPVKDVGRNVDYLALVKEEDGGNRPTYLICHGHQFDTTTNGMYGEFVGEVFSETMAWAFCGADRTWSHDDEPARWLAAAPEAIFNEVVSDRYALTRVTEAGTKKASWDEELLESIFGHEVAWDYYDAPKPLDALLNIVAQGKEFMKFRHLDERDIRDIFKAKIERLLLPHPMLVLGHSHEVRLRPYDGRQPDLVAEYANTGSCGRFGNFVSALEIVAGEPTLVVWTRDADGAVTRRPLQYDDHRNLLAHEPQALP